MPNQTHNSSNWEDL